MVTLSEPTVYLRRGGHTVLEKRPAEEVLFYDTAGEIFAAASAKASAFFRVVDGVPPNDSPDYTPMDIVHAGVRGDVRNTFDGDTWSVEDVVDVNHGKASPAAVGSLKMKCSAANVAPPRNPTAIVALKSAVLQHHN